MNLAIAAPLILGMANTTAKAVQETASGMFSLWANSQAPTIDAKSEPSDVTQLFAEMGQLGSEQVERSINESLRRLEDLIRAHFSQSNPPLPDNFQLRIDAVGNVFASGAGEFDPEIDRIIQEDPEATRLVDNLATAFAALTKSRRNQEYAHRYNLDPQAADAWLTSAKEQPNPLDQVDLHFSADNPPAYRPAEL